jgi:membrane-associated protease RseP (regulator of RpoE activity)
MTAVQLSEARPRRRWPWLVAVVAVGVLVVSGLRVYAAVAKDEPAKEDKKKDDKKKDEPAQKDPLEQMRLGQTELMAEMFKLLQDPGGPNPENLQRLMGKAMKVTQALHNQLGGGPGLGDADRSGYVEKRLGARVESPADALVEQLDLPRGQGQVIVQVTPDSAAARAGLKPSDILLELGGKPVVRASADFASALAKMKSDVPLSAVVLRKGVKKELKGLKLQEVPPDPPLLPALPQGGFPQAGLPQPGFPQAGFPQAGFPQLNLPRLHLPGAGLPFGRPGVFNRPGPGGRMPFGPLGGRPGAGQVNVQKTFLVSHQEGGVNITVSGMVDNGTVAVDDITIDNGKTQQFKSVEQVPEVYRGRVKALIETATRRR